MKAKYILIVLITLAFVGCDDNTGGLGLGMLPGSDGIKVESKVFKVQTTSQLSGPVYAKTSKGYVGRFTDKEYGFGYYEGSFLTELNCIDDLEFPKPYDAVTNRSEVNMAGNLDEAYLYSRISILYTEFFGDSLNPMQVGIYELDRKLEKNHYTDIHPEEYLKDPKAPLGKRTFTVTDLTDSTRTSGGYYLTVNIPLADEFGKNLIRQNWEHPDYFRNSEAFIDNVFKGLYVKTEAGDGTVIYVDQILLDVVFKSYALDSLGNVLKTYDEANDSTQAYYRSFASTMEVIQANQIKTSDEVKEKAGERQWTYLKTPAGIYTKAQLPVGDIVRGLNLETDTINGVKLALTGYAHETENMFSMSAPSNVLLIKDKDVNEFFEKNKLPDNVSSYIATLSSNKYTFNNISRLVTSLITDMQNAKAEIEKEGGTWDEKAWLEDNSLAIIPIAVNYTTTSSTYGQTTTILTNVQHNLKPTFIKLKGGAPDPNTGGSLLDLEVVYTRFAD